MSKRWNNGRNRFYLIIFMNFNLLSMSQMHSVIKVGRYCWFWRECSDVCPTVQAFRAISICASEVWAAWLNVPEVTSTADRVLSEAHCLAVLSGDNPLPEASATCWAIGNSASGFACLRVVITVRGRDISLNNVLLSRDQGQGWEKYWQESNA